MLRSLVDRLYDRFDLWRDRPTREADYSKVRGFVLYMTVAFCYVFIAVVFPLLMIHLRQKFSLPTTVLVIVPMAMLGLAAGERALIAFFKAWSAKKDNVESLVADFVPHEWKHGDPDAGVM